VFVNIQQRGRTVFQRLSDLSASAKQSNPADAFELVSYRTAKTSEASGRM